jgi:hypothetical protein
MYFFWPFEFLLLRKFCLVHFAHFFIGSLVLGESSFLSSLYILVISPLSDVFTIAKLWKQPRCPNTDEWIKKMWYLYTILCGHEEE